MRDQRADTVREREEIQPADTKRTRSCCGDDTDAGPGRGEGGGVEAEMVMIDCYNCVPTDAEPRPAGLCTERAHDCLCACLFVFYLVFIKFLFIIIFFTFMFIFCEARVLSNCLFVFLGCLLALTLVWFVLFLTCLLCFFPGLF